MTDFPILACDNVQKHFVEAGQRLEVLRGVELQVQAGETIAIIGASGSGKTTLLQILGGLDLPTSGTVRLMGKAFADLSDAARGDLRNQALGFVYQFHHLLPEFSALENVAMPLLVRRAPAAQQPVVDRFLVKKLGREFLVRVADIDWIEASGNYVNLRVGTRAYPLRETMAGIESRLAGAGFMRVHRSAIVNLDRVQEIVPFDTGDGEIRLAGEVRVPVSRRYRKELREKAR